MLDFLLIMVLAVPARADVSLVQVVQSQTSRGDDGLFGKTWITASGRRMRIVSGFARKVSSGEKRVFEEPARLVQILNLDTTALLRIDPVAKTYEERPFSDVRYADSLHKSLSRGAAVYSISASTVSVRAGELKREAMGASCDHYHILVRMTLAGPDGKKVDARMAQDIWVAPVMGTVQKGLLDLINFEASYRKVTGWPLTPLDYETYQLREAAAYLRVKERDLQDLIGRVKKSFVEIPGYPLTSSVSWWREPETDETVAPAPADKAIPNVGRDARPPALTAPRRRSRLNRFVRVRPLYGDAFRPVQWHRNWVEIDDLLAQTGKTFGVFTLGPLRDRGRSRPLRYGDFQRGLEEVVAGLDRIAEAREPERPANPGRSRRTPFYEIFTEMNQLEFLDTLPEGHFNPPAGYRRKP